MIKGPVFCLKTMQSEAQELLRNEPQEITEPFRILQNLEYERRTAEGSPGLSFKW